MVVVLLWVDALIAHVGGGDGTPRPGTSSGVPRTVLGGGPVVAASGAVRPGLRVPPRTVALTFDDGPSAYSRRILDLLERYRVPATFFVLGSQVSAHVAELRRMVRDGDEIGVHTFTHPDLGSVGSWREHMELDASQLAIAAATGRVTNLLRLPYSSHVGSLAAPEWQAVRSAGRYWVAFTDLDSQDWRRGDPAKIAAAATPALGRGAVVMMHDGGGDRSKTVAALAILIPRLLADGYSFTTVSKAVSVPVPAAPADAGQRLRGWVLILTVSAARTLVRVLEVLFAVAGVLAVARTLALLSFARRHAGRAPHPGGEVASWPPVSVVVPAYNERVGIEACIRSLMSADYPPVDVVVVDDGSTDGTAQLRRIARSSRGTGHPPVQRGQARGADDRHPRRPPRRARPRRR